MHEDWIDRWKGLLIALVVLGHAVGVASHFAQDMTKDLFSYVYKVIYCFHMPAFFCVAGYVWRTKNESMLTFCVKKFRRLLVPYFVFAVLSGAVYYLTSGAFGAAVCHASDAYYAKLGALPTIRGLLCSIVHAGGWPDNGVFRGNSVLWFLPTMFTVCVLYRSIDLRIRNKGWQLVVGLVFLLGSFYVPSGLPWGLTLAFFYLPFLILGRWVLPKIMDCGKKNVGVILLLCVIYCAVCWLAPNAYCRNKFLFWRVAFFALAVLGCWSSALVVRRFDFSFLARLGLSSLGIMLMHKYVILVAGMKLTFICSLYAGNVVVAIAIVGVVTVLALAIAYCATKVVEHYIPVILGGRRI